MHSSDRGTSAWSDSEADDDETTSLNPHVIEQFEFDGDGEGLRRKREGVIALVKKNGQESIAGFDRFTVLTMLLSLLGVCLIIRGLLLRLDSVPTPLPFVSLPIRLCEQRDSHGFVLLNGACPKTGTFLSEDTADEPIRIPLHGNFLLHSIQYVPRVAFPEIYRIEGTLNFGLEQRGRSVFESGPVSFGHLIPENLYRLGGRGTEMPVYIPRFSNRQGLSTECESPLGCAHRFEESMVEVAFPQKPFQIPDDETQELNRIEQKPVEALELVLRNLAIRLTTQSKLSTVPLRSSKTPPPEILLSFHQYMLTERQIDGVKITIAGFVFLFAGVSLFVLPRAVSRSKSVKSKKLLR
mmetsp:Transcript_17883/g.43751  ORF Transcript_17883/g.43751 Transcript_17883/m.43751 type:complete len:353 (+) Transcript_17883:216-1274(+)